MWPSPAALAAALAAATIRTPPAPGTLPFPHGTATAPALPTPTGWSTPGSLAAATARLR